MKDENGCKVANCERKPEEAFGVAATNLVFVEVQRKSDSCGQFVVGAI